MRAMLWEDWRVRYAIVSDLKPEPNFHHAAFCASGCVNDASWNSRSIIRCMQPIAFQTFAFLLWSRATAPLSPQHQRVLRISSWPSAHQSSDLWLPTAHPN